MADHVSTGSVAFDGLLEGGLERGVITTLFGAPGCGKSNLTMLTAVEAAKRGKKVVFVDTENSLSTERIKQLAPQQHKAILKNLIILSPTTFEEQKKYFSDLYEIMAVEKPDIIIIDSLTMLYRLQLGSEEEIQTTNKEMALQISRLSEIARKRNVPILVTNQVYADFDTKDVRMVGGDLLKYWSKCIIKLDQIDSVRKASIWRHRSLPAGKEIYFEIKDSGLFEVPKPKKKFSLF